MDTPPNVPGLRPTVFACSTGARQLTEDDIPSLVEELFSPTRERPLVAVTASASTGEPWLDPDELAVRLAGHADVVFLETGEPTWALSEAVPELFDVYGGAVRIWWPGMTEDSSPFEHPLLFARDEDQGERARRIVLAKVLPEREGGEALRRHAGRGDARSATAAEEAKAWQRVAEAYNVGDVVRGRVEAVKDFGAFVELHPGARGLVHKSQMDYSFVEDPREFVNPGQVVTVEILSLEPHKGRAELSMKKALGRPARPTLPLEPGGELYLSDIDDAVFEAVSSRDADDGQDTPGQRINDLEAAVGTLQEDRGGLRTRLRALEKELRGAQDRLAHLQRQTSDEIDPLSSEAAFLLAVRLAYARMLGEGERHDHPLLRMRVGGGFLERLRQLEGVGLDKVIEVCCQVACDLAPEIPGREVHQLRSGEGGSPTRTRTADGAKAWRCSLQDKTAGARRLHWWRIPGDDGGAIEFASVGVHDDDSMPE